MTKMYISLEGSMNEIRAAANDPVVPVRSKAATPAYRCKVYRARLEHGAASNYAPLGLKFTALAAPAGSR
jgi:hypothetical protein